MTTQDPVNLNASPNPSKDPGKLKILDVLGPGLITGASDDDPSGIATYSQIGAQFGYTMNWTLIFSYPLMVAIQIISGRLGRTTGRGVAGNLRKFYSNWLVYSAVPLLLVANVINIGADIGAMGDATKLVIGGPSLLYALAFGVACAAAQVFFDYNKYARILKWLSLALLTYVATLFVVKIDWRGFGFGLVVPHLEFSKELLTAVVAVFGTTISPYLFFWQASQEVEEIEDNADRERLKDAPGRCHVNRRRAPGDEVWLVTDSGGDASHDFPLCHGVQPMEVGGKGGATGPGWNEVIADGGEHGDEPLQASWRSKALHRSLAPAQWQV